jgi:YfiH family protein
VARGDLELLECPRFARIPWVRHAYSTRGLRPKNGPGAKLGAGFNAEAAGLNLGLGEDHRHRRLFLDCLGVGTPVVASLRQIHSSVVHYAWTEGPGDVRYTPAGCDPAQAASEGPPCGDALVTDQPGILLSVLTADCVPLLLVDPARRAIAAVHAGWRGSLERIAEKTVSEMRRGFQSQPEELLAAIGPSIRSCCYEVGSEVVEAFCGRFTGWEGYFRQPPPDDGSRALALKYPLIFLSTRPPDRAPKGVAAARLDLVAVTRDQLQNAGLRSANIHVADYCTACRTDLFFSHRKEGKTGRMMAAIGMI